jgi:hypothetical protein
MTITQLPNTTNTLLFNNKNRLHVSAYHEPFSVQFIHSFNQLHIDMRAHYGIPYGLQLLKTIKTLEIIVFNYILITLSHTGSHNSHEHKYVR